jgi:phosphate transport system substrate-binding protein
MLPFMRKIADTYSQKTKDTLVQTIGGGSGTGIEAILNNSVSLAMSSRPIKHSERLEFEQQGVTVKSVAVGIDALAIIVHPSNPIKRITQQQLKDIFSGKINNWIDLGGENIPIELFIRDKTSGTHDFFRDNAMGGAAYAPEAKMVVNNNETVKEVSKYPGAISYVGFYYVKNEKYLVKPLNVSYNNRPFVLPTKENAKNRNYPITRSLFIYYRSDRENEVLPFIRYVLSPEGQHNVSTLGYLPVAKYE